MNEFDAKSLVILGRQPQLGVAELESLYGSDHVLPIGSAAMLDLPPEEIDFPRLGGSLKLARMLSVLPTVSWGEIEAFLLDNIPKHLENVPPGGFTLGVSVYKFSISTDSLHRSLMTIKKAVRRTGRSMRVVPNKILELNSAQVLHNKLTSKGAWELLIIRDRARTIIAQSFIVQDIEAYAARDQVRPKRDPRTGMLPPKLAQIIINLANPEPGSLVLDPFCGTGVVLQEALLMGYDVLGTDKDPRLVDYARANIDWLKGQQAKATGSAGIAEADATRFKWQAVINSVASEIYLGRPLSTLPPRSQLEENIREVNDLLQKFLKNLAPQIEPGTTLCLAVPAWRDTKRQTFAARLPVIDHLTDMGYTYLDLKHAARDDLVYFRSDQTVARQLIRLSKA